MSDARPLQQMLQRVQPCSVAALHEGKAATASHAVIVCDVALDCPKTIEALRTALAQHRQSPATPVLFLLRDPSHVTLGQARLAGATATLQQPVSAAKLLAAVTDLIAAERRHARPSTPSADVKAGVTDAGKCLTELFQAGSAQTPVSAANLEQGGELVLDVIRQTRIQAWLDVVWSYDDATYQHCLLVAGLAAAFALELALPPKMQHVLSQAALIHDIGKAQVPRRILNKAGRLTAAELVVMRSHAEAGYRMLAGQPGFDRQLLDVVRHHHEYLDGSGYPDGLQGSQISRMVRIVTICDVYAALVERRVYKQPLAPKMALAHLDDLGDKVDQPLVKAFRNVVRET